MYTNLKGVVIRNVNFSDERGTVDIKEYYSRICLVITVCEQMQEGTDTHFGNYLPTHFHGTLFLSLYESLYPFEMSETLPNAILFSSSIVHRV